MVTTKRFCPICEAHLDAMVCPTDLVPTVRADFEASDQADDALGRVISGRFRIERLLGQGASGRVYRAQQLSVERPVALKLLQPHHAKDRVHVRRFYREARAATKLTGAHVVQVFDFGVDDDTKTPFIAMELIEGETLKDVLARGPVPPRVAARIGAQIAKALCDAGDAGIVHRDLKPANIMWSGAGEPQVKVMDFGIAKELAAGDTETLTGHGAAIGTPTYMAPEQASGGAIDPRTDLYALGCILFELVTGRPPFAGEARAQLLVDHLLKSAPPLPAKVGAEPVPPALITLVARLLEKSPADRPASARVVLAELGAIASGTLPAGWPFGVKAALAGGLAGAIALAAMLLVSPGAPPAPALAPAPAPALAPTAAPTPTPAPAPTAAIEHLVIRGAAASVRLHQGAPRDPEITGDGTRVSFAIEGGRMTVTVAPPLASDLEAAELRIELWAPQWKSIKVAGSATVTSTGRLTATDLSLALSGSARADLDLVGTGLITSIRGSSEAVLRGLVDRHEARAGGASRLDARFLVTKETSLAAAGTSDATVNARTLLDARNEGTGDVLYLGKPTDLTTDGAVEPFE